jgi:hypothetical protein
MFFTCNRFIFDIGARGIQYVSLFTKVCNSRREMFFVSSSRSITVPFLLPESRIVLKFQPVQMYRFFQVG